MPKSKGRKRQPHHNARSRERRPQSVSEQQARAVASIPMIVATDRAEALGDARAALDLIISDLSGDPNFWRPERVQRLLQLQVFGSLLPRWATSRWILAQAAQSVHEGARPLALEALQRTIELLGGDEALVGASRADAQAKVIDHDWVFRQLLLYELGGLRHFLDRVAGPALLAGADRIEDWASAPMGGFRLVWEDTRSVLWVDLATGAEVRSLNLGTASLLEPTCCAIGRLVPIDAGAMFETVPLFVPDDVAVAVAQEPADWVGLLAAACREEQAPVERIVTGGHTFRMLTDVPTRWLVSLICRRLDPTGGLRVAEEWAAEPVSLHATFVRVALDGALTSHDQWEEDPWPSVAASLLEPQVFAELRPTLTPHDAPKLLRLATRLAAPASDLCRGLAEEVRDVG